MGQKRENRGNNGERSRPSIDAKLEIAAYIGVKGQWKGFGFREGERKVALCCHN